MSSTREGLNIMADMFLNTISNVIQAGNEKKTQLTNTMKTKFDEKMEKNRKERNEKKKKRLEQLAEEKRIEREIQMRNDVINAREELVAVANAWREGK